MSQRTENQVAEMKKQTIGVEVEMNSITREKAARVAAEFFGTRRCRDHPTATAILPGQPGTRAAGNGSSRETAALPVRKMRNARWSRPSSPTLTWKPCRS